MRTAGRSNLLAKSYKSSFVNRAVAVYRHIVGIPTDQGTGSGVIFDSAEKRSLVVALNPSFPQDKLREGSQVWENMRFFPFAEPALEARSGPKGSE